MTEPMLDKVAKPGDPDLDMDVSGLTLTSVVAVGTEVMLRLVDGTGWWVKDGERSEFTGGEEGGTVTEIAFVVQFVNPRPAWLAEVIRRLEGWRDDGNPLRVCGAPGRATTMIRSFSDWLPMPRNWPPPDTLDAEEMPEPLT